jgi:DNA processing protein
MEMSEDREWLWYQMTTVKGIGPYTIRKLIEYAGSLEEALELSVEEIERAHICNVKMLQSWKEARMTREALRTSYEHLRERGMCYYSIEHECYPAKLKNFSDAPLGLWVRGQLPFEDRPAAAVIGSRGCSSCGLELAGALGRKLAEMGVQVISGMASGIDAAGQWGALQAGGYSLGILAGGVDVCYPRENIELYETLRKQGGLLSENPPGTPNMPALFRLRNRLISGLADCVIVVEARQKSGTQITVNCALDQGREVFALPGRMTDPLSKGCNQMISQGARILWDFSELAEFFHMEEQ